jgi:uncharacterized protein (TIGR02145 family)
MKYFIYILIVTLSINVYSQENKTIQIGKQNWMSKNLDVTTFRNGDIIKEAKTLIEWKKNCKAGKPVWCYYKFNALNGKKYGKIYNWVAVKDYRGIAPKGYRIPYNSDIETLENTTKNIFFSEIKENVYNSPKTVGFQLKSKTGWEKFKGQDGNGNDKFSFNALPGGYFDGFNFTGVGEEIYFWTNDPENFNYHLSNGWFGSDINGFVSESAQFCCKESFGFYVRCIKE